MPEIKIPSNRPPESIEILKPMPCIITSGMTKDSNGHVYLSKGVQLYSGITGKKVGIIKNLLKFPFDREKLINNLLQRKLEVTKDKTLTGEGLNFLKAQQPDFVHFLNFEAIQNRAN